MVNKFLFWISCLLVVIGAHAPEGNLYYFFAVLLLAATVGRVLQRRSKKLAAVASLPVVPPGASNKAKALAKPG